MNINVRIHCLIRYSPSNLYREKCGRALYRIYTLTSACLPFDYFYAKILNKFFSEEFHDAFCAFDRRQEGYIINSDIKLVMRSLGFNPTEREVENMCMKVDMDGKSRLNGNIFQVLANHL